MDHLHARLVRQHRKMQSFFFSVHPLSNGRQYPTFNGQRVLIVADVIDSGTLARNLAASLLNHGADVVGLLCVVEVTSSDSQVPRTFIRISNDKTVELRSLTHYPIPRLTDSEERSAAIEKLDAGTLLRRIIADQRHGILLDARKQHDENGIERRVERAAFQLSSNRYQRQFVTLWGVFDKQWLFEDCMEHLARYIIELRKKYWFRTIVTCTATALHILEHLQARIETEDSPIDVYYLGPYPFHSVKDRRPAEIQGKPALILTDVIASRNLVRHLVSVVEHLGGTTAVVVAVVSLSEEYASNRETLLTYGAKKIPLASLSTYPIRELKAGEFDEVIQIDPATILPQEQLQSRQSQALISKPETLTHFDASEALLMGFWQSGERQFTAGMRLDRLLERKGPLIWAKLARYVPNGGILVTTFAREDVRFHAFLQRCAAQSGREVEAAFVPRCDSIESDFPYFTTAQVRTKIKGKRVILVLSSLQTSGKLRKLVSLLAQSAVEGITVICLLNRMGRRTVDFVSRIKRMLQGLGSKSPHRNFRFVQVYDVEDLHGEAFLRVPQSPGCTRQ
jgi:orotate phosphoribosyltransferase